MVEYDDFELDMQRKEALVEEAKKLEEMEDLNAALKRANQLKRDWRRLQDDESGYEEELREKFEASLDKVYAKRKDLAKSAVGVKEELIAKAKEILANTNLNEATNQMKDLMTSWKESASAGKEKDDELWAQFNETRQAFYEKRKEYFAALREQFANSKSVKEGIIAKAKEVAESKEWKKATEQMNELMAQWKTAGSAGKEHEESLWAEFSAVRKEFNTKKDAYYTEFRAKLDEKFAQKSDLVAKAKEIVASNTFAKETTEKVKALRDEWKKVGSCGKEREDSIWNEFNTTINTYFANLKAHNEERHANWVARMKEQADYKKGLIEKVKRDINRLKNDAAYTLKESDVVEIEAEIAEKGEYINKLEADIADIESKIK